MATVFEKTHEKTKSTEFNTHWPKTESTLKSEPATKNLASSSNLYVIKYEAARFHDSPWTLANEKGEKDKEKVKTYEGSIELAVKYFGEMNVAAERKGIFNDDFFKGPDAEERKAMFLAYASFEGIGKATVDLVGCNNISDLIAKAKVSGAKEYLTSLYAGMQKEFGGGGAGGEPGGGGAPSGGAGGTGVAEVPEIKLPQPRFHVYEPKLITELPETVEQTTDETKQVVDSYLKGEKTKADVIAKFEEEGGGAPYGVREKLMGDVRALENAKKNLDARHKLPEVSGHTDVYITELAELPEIQSALQVKAIDGHVKYNDAKEAVEKEIDKRKGVLASVELKIEFEKLRAMANELRDYTKPDFKGKLGEYNAALDKFAERVAHESGVGETREATTGIRDAIDGVVRDGVYSVPEGGHLRAKTAVLLSLAVDTKMDGNNITEMRLFSAPPALAVKEISPDAAVSAVYSVVGGDRTKQKEANDVLNAEGGPAKLREAMGKEVEALTINLNKIRARHNPPGTFEISQIKIVELSTIPELKGRVMKNTGITDENRTVDFKVVENAVKELKKEKETALTNVEFAEKMGKLRDLSPAKMSLTAEKGVFKAADKPYEAELVATAEWLAEKSGAKESDVPAIIRALNGLAETGEYAFAGEMSGWRAEFVKNISLVYETSYDETSKTIALKLPSVEETKEERFASQPPTESARSEEHPPSPKEM